MDNPPDCKKIFKGFKPFKKDYPTLDIGYSKLHGVSYLITRARVYAWFGEGSLTKKSQLEIL